MAGLAVADQPPCAILENMKKPANEQTSAAARARRIVRTSFVGIAANVLRAAILAELQGRFPNRSIAMMRQCLRQIA